MSPLSVDRRLRATIRSMQVPVYPAPVRGVARMDANTNLFGPNPAVGRAARRLDALEVQHYPTGNSDALRDALARFWKVGRAQVVVGNGSDELFDLIAKAFVNPGDRVAFPTPSFVMYPFYAKVNLGIPTPVPLIRSTAFSLDVDGILSARAKLTLIASPNSPTGNAFPARAIERVIRGSRGIVVVDEAYAEFSDQNLAPWVRRFDNLLVTRTFSKAYGLAGLRVGYAIGPPALVDAVLRAKPPFNVGAFSEAAAIEALRHRPFVRRCVRVIRSERARVSAALRAMGLGVNPSDANFLLIDVGRPARAVRDALRRRGVLVRDLTDFRGLAACLRVTLGPRAVNDRFLRALGGSLDAAGGASS